MKKVEELIVAALRDMIDLQCVTAVTNQTRCKLVYPVKRDNTTRISEQEARFLFVQNVEQTSDYLYSIEAPTRKKYKFSGKTLLSGNIDLCLYENGKRKHLIEFKALNPDQRLFSKDFEKLFNDEDGLDNYFVHVLKNTNKGTIPSIEGKYKKAIEKSRKTIEPFKSRLKIFVCVIEKISITKYEIDENGSMSEPITIL